MALATVSGRETAGRPYAFAPHEAGRESGEAQVV